jgi:hypothetical protein
MFQVGTRIMTGKEVSDDGHGVARKKGVWRVAANYEALPDASAEVRVE